jgi:hypothetical protein
MTAKIAVRVADHRLIKESDVGPLGVTGEGGGTATDDLDVGPDRQRVTVAGNPAEDELLATGLLFTKEFNTPPRIMSRDRLFRTRSVAADPPG